MFRFKHDTEGSYASRAATLAPVPSELERTPPLTTWDQSEPEDQAALQRVEAQSMALFDQWAADPQSPQQEAEDQPAEPRQWFLPLLVPVLGAACGIALFWMAPSTPQKLQLPALETEGKATLQWRAKTLSVQVESSQKAALTDPQHWSLKLQGGAKLLLKRSSRRNAKIQLTQGSLVAHVRPGVMKAFDVRSHHGYDVLVKGTVFSVRQGPDWLRVEVMRGRVQIKRRDKLMYTLKQGQAIRITTSGEHLSYKVPGQAQLTMPRLMRWLREKHPKQLMLYAQDIASQKEWAPGQRRALLEVIANLLVQLRRQLDASSLWYQLYKWQPTGFEGQTALFQAAQQCRKGKAPTKRCLRLYQTWLKRFPKGMSQMHEASLYWSIRLTPSGPSRRRGLRHYFKRYPQGIYRSELERLR